MKLPNCDRAIVPEAKIVGYLLSPAHPDGQSKERFFRRFGFTPGEWQVLADALRRHATDHQVVGTEESPFGVRYVVEGIIHTPNGRTPLVRSVWFVEQAEDIPRFVTAYPLLRSVT